MSIRVVMIAALLCAAPAVSAKKYTAPTPLAAQLPVEVVLTQQEIGIDVPDNSAVAGQFGLIGALVGAAISNAQAQSAEQHAAHVRNMLVEYRFNPRFETALRAKLASEGLSPDPQFRFLQTPWDAYLSVSPEALKKAADAGTMPYTGTVLEVTPHYALDYAMQTLSVRVSLNLVDRVRKDNGKYKDKMLLMRTYRFDFPLDPPVGKAADNIARWQSIGGKEIARMLDLGIEQVTDMIAYDFSLEGRAEAARPVKKEFGQFKDFKTFGRQLRTGDDWYWLRSGKGYLMSLRGVNPLHATAQLPVAPALPAVAADAAVAAPADTPAVPAEAAGAAPAGT